MCGGGGRANKNDLGQVALLDGNVLSLFVRNVLRNKCRKGHLAVAGLTFINSEILKTNSAKMNGCVRAPGGHLLDPPRS